jgi:hypothetical protein
MVVLIFASFLRATSADCVDLTPPATFMGGKAAQSFSGARASALLNPTNEARASGATRILA